MAGETLVTVVGNLTADPELRHTATGMPVAGFTIASTPKVFNRERNEFIDGEPLFLRCSLWHQAGENAAASLTQGTRVIVTGKLRQRTFDDKEGQRHTTIEIDAEDVAVSLMYARASVTKTWRPGTGPQARPAPAAGPAVPDTRQPPQAAPAEPHLF
ncbi:single-stranded DNA-binding protein [Streptomyces sp. NPDC050485]|uniref:single-stranded DNA-binding protein n=1 Tax=Streptomyces sp. NPDC050485 TaxID=3365617 RepID=UPI00378C3D7C